MPILSSLSLVRYGAAKSEATYGKVTLSEVEGKGLRGPPLTVFVLILPHYSEIGRADQVIPIRRLTLKLIHRGSSARWKWKLGDT